jgi:hypothetical protein
LSLEREIRTMDKLKDTLRIFVVPTEILDVEELDVYEKMVYMVLRSYANGQDDTAFPSYETIAKKGSMGRKKAIQCIKKLEEMGLVVKEERKMVKNGSIVNTSNLYTIKRPAEVVSEKHHPSVSETPPLVSDRHHPSVPQTPELNHLKELDLKNSSSSQLSDDRKMSIIHGFSSKYPEKRVDLIAMELLSDETAVMDTEKQFRSLLEYRIVNSKETTGKPPRKPRGTKQPVRTEHIPEHFNAEYIQPRLTEEQQKEIEQKKRAIEEKLKKARGE